MNTLKKLFRNIQTLFPWLQELRFSLRTWVIKTFNKPPEDDFLLIQKFQPSSDKVFLDVGANRGDMILCMMLNEKLNNKIIGFEPNGIIFKSTAERSFIKDNPRVDLLNIGLSSQGGELTLYTPQYRNWAFDGLSSFSYESAYQWLSNGMWNFNENLLTIQKHSCKVEPLDHYDFKPYFIKIDVEGFELDVIKGAYKTIEKHLPILLVEDITEDIKTVLRPLGYAFYGFKKGQGLYEGSGELNTFCLQPQQFELLTK